MILIAFFLIGLIIILWLAACGWRNKALQSAKEAQGMALLASNLEGQLKQSEAKAEAIAEIAKHAIDEAAKVAQLNPEDLWKDAPPLRIKKARPEMFYVAPTVRFCSCNVSVRSDKWPVACPACGKMVGDDSILDADLID